MSKTIVQEYVVGEFRGSFPDVPTAEGVDLNALRVHDDDPMMVTLPIIPQIGATSRNGLLYDAALADDLVRQINDKRPEGIFGHLKDEERSTSYPEPAGIWVGAARVGDQVWAKSYIPPGAARDRIRRLKATGGQIATSIYGKGKYESTATKGVRRLIDFDLETLDFAPPGRAALANGAQPVITAELEQGDPEMTKDELIAELTASDIPAPLREQIVADAAANSAQANRVAELEQQITDRDALVTELQTTVAEFRQQKFEAALDVRIAELTNWQITAEDAQNKLDAFRRTLRSRVIAELGDERADEKVAETVKAIWDDLEPLAETLRDSLAGPAAVIGGKGRSQGRSKLEDTPDARQKARAEFGFGV